jgi:hypothetical protein
LFITRSRLRKLQVRRVDLEVTLKQNEEGISLLTPIIFPGKQFINIYCSICYTVVQIRLFPSTRRFGYCSLFFSWSLRGNCYSRRLFLSWPCAADIRAFSSTVLLVELFSCSCVHLLHQMQKTNTCTSMAAAQD